MAMEKEALTHKIEDDLAARNRNWDKLTSHLADYANALEGMRYKYENRTIAVGDSTPSGSGSNYTFTATIQHDLGVIPIGVLMTNQSSTGAGITTTVTSKRSDSINVLFSRANEFPAHSHQLGILYIY